MKLPPADVLATWPTPNYIDPTTRGDSVLVVTIVFSAIAFVITCLRLYTRIKITCSPGIDDILIVVALVCYNRNMASLAGSNMFLGFYNCDVRGHLLSH